MHAAGRRSGKTVCNAIIAALYASDHPRSRVWYVTPDWKQVPEFLGPLLEISRRGVRRFEASKARVQFTTGAILECRNATHQDRLRGHGLDLIIVDEYQDCSAQLFDAVLRPMLADRGGRAVFGGTPKGIGSHFHALWQLGQAGGEWASWRYTARETGTPAVADMDRAREDAEVRGPTALKLYRREWEADWTAFVGQVFELWDEAAMVTDASPSSRIRSVIGVDWGFTEAHLGVAIGVVMDRDGRWWVQAETAAAGQTVEGWWVPRIAEMQARLRAETVWCDPARPDAIAALRRAGARNVREASNAVVDGVVHLAMLMESGCLRVHPTCRVLRSQVVGYRWEQARDGTVREKPRKERDDAVDALRYALYSEVAQPKPWAA